MAKDPLDAQIGSRIRAARKLRGQTLQSLGGQLGVTYQQVRKYEIGVDRISASMLFRLSQTLDVDFACFFPDQQRGATETPGQNHEDLAIAAALDRVTDPDVRRYLSKLIDALDATKV